MAQYHQFDFVMTQNQTKRAINGVMSRFYSTLINGAAVLNLEVRAVEVPVILALGKRF